MNKIADPKGPGASAFAKLSGNVLNYQDSLDTLIDIFKSKSYKQNIKSKSRQSETLVIQKNDFFDIVNSMLTNSKGTAQADPSRGQLTPEEMLQIEELVLLTPKIKSMYAMRHIENLFQTLFQMKN